MTIKYEIFRMNYEKVNNEQISYYLPKNYWMCLIYQTKLCKQFKILILSNFTSDSLNYSSAIVDSKVKVTA